MAKTNFYLHHNAFKIHTQARMIRRRLSLQLSEAQSTGLQRRPLALNFVSIRNPSDAWKLDEIGLKYNNVLFKKSVFGLFIVRWSRY